LAGALSQTALGSLPGFPGPLAGFKLACFSGKLGEKMKNGRLGQGRGKKGGEGRRRYG